MAEEMEQQPERPTIFCEPGIGELISSQFAPQVGGFRVRADVFCGDSAILEKKTGLKRHD